MSRYTRFVQLRFCLASNDAVLCPIHCEHSFNAKCDVVEEKALSLKGGPKGKLRIRVHVIPLATPFDPLFRVRVVGGQIVVMHSA